MDEWKHGANNEGHTRSRWMEKIDTMWGTGGWSVLLMGPWKREWCSTLTRTVFRLLDQKLKIYHAWHSYVNTKNNVSLNALLSLLLRFETVCWNVFIWFNSKMCTIHANVLHRHIYRYFPLLIINDMYYYSFFFFFPGLFLHLGSPV